MIFKLLAIMLLAYFIGAIPFGLIIGKLVRGIDVREHGSGKTGFANVLRTAGAGAGALTFAADVGKGILAVWLGGIIVGESTAVVGPLTFDFQAVQVVAAMAAVAGHNWSVFIRFKGGRGVDTSLGGLIAMAPFIGLACLATGLVVISVSRYVSLGSMCGAGSSILILIPLVALGHQPAEYLIYGTIATALVIYQHRDNIGRLRAGTERRLKLKGEQR
ncbi:glycerol-3-phosphate 1-O-acyltransferase PlsY [Dehalococcoidia bacterium]|nr:glycerol-3-phosphate 1-O-acyltransferase PlsY [Dehalococcoidia bacterium]